MLDLLPRKIAEFRRNAEACEDWASTVPHPDIREELLSVAREWRDMADRFERLRIARPSDGEA
jgi:hypothetical protein